MNVNRYIETRTETTYGKKVRILDSKSHRNLGPWYRNAGRDIVEVKVTEKYLFIFVK